MIVSYEAIIKFRVTHDVNTLTDIKDNTQFAHDLAHMVCDEATQCDAVATYEIIKSSIDVKEK